MGKITIELEDTLPDRVEGAISDLREAVEHAMRSERERWEGDDSPDEIIDALDLRDRIHEIADSAVPIYTREIETAWFLHGSELEQAYEDAGIGENPRENHGMSAVYFYIESRMYAELEACVDSVLELLYSETQTRV